MSNKVNKYTVIFDGGHDKNGSYGSYIIFRGSKPVAISLRVRYDNKYSKTGNQSEYYTLVRALSALNELAEEGSRVEIYGDSKLVISQVMGDWKARNNVMRKYRDMCLNSLEPYTWQAEWWPREQSLQFFQH
jgi:ribonuclease HI